MNISSSLLLAIWQLTSLHQGPCSSPCSHVSECQSPLWHTESLSVAVRSVGSAGLCHAGYGEDWMVAPLSLIPSCR